MKRLGLTAISVIALMATTVASAATSKDYVVSGWNAVTEEVRTTYRQFREFAVANSLLHPDSVKEFNCLPVEDPIASSGLLTVTCMLFLNDEQKVSVQTWLSQTNLSLQLEPAIKYSSEFSRRYFDIPDKGRMHMTWRYVSFATLAEYNSFLKVVLPQGETFTEDDVKRYFSGLVAYFSSDQYFLFVMKEDVKKLNVCAFVADTYLRVLTPSGWKDAYYGSTASIPFWEPNENLECWGDISKLVLSLK